MYTPPAFPRTTGLTEGNDALLYVLEEYDTDQFRLKVGASIEPTPPPSSLDDFTATGTGTAAKIISATTACSSVLVQAAPSNTTNILIGNATTQHFVLQPGDAVSIEIDDASKVYCKAVSGSPVINCHAS